MIKKVLTWLGIAFLIFSIAFNPNSAASVFESLGGTIGDIARGIGRVFLTGQRLAVSRHQARRAFGVAAARAG